MLLQHRQYLALLDEIQYLKKDNTLLRQQNTILTQELVKQRQKRLQLEEHHQKNMKLIEELHSKTIIHQEDSTKQIVSKMNEYNQSTKVFLEDRFKVLENATCNEARQAELKQAKNKLDLYELTDFANKIKNIYKEVQNPDSSQIKKITLSQMVKWVKNMGLIVITQQKLGLTGSMSTTSMKKQGQRSSKMKQNKSLLNCSQSKSRIKPCQG